MGLVSDGSTIPRMAILCLWVCAARPDGWLPFGISLSAQVGHVTRQRKLHGVCRKRRVCSYMKKWANLAAAVDAPIAFLFAFEHQWQRTTDMADSLSIGESCPASIFSKLLPQEQSGGEAAAAGEVIYPAVG